MQKGIIFAEKTYYLQKRYIIYKEGRLFGVLLEFG